MLGFMPMLHSFDYCSFEIDFEIWKCESSNPVLFFFFSLKVVLAIVGPLRFHTHFRILRKISTKINAIQEFDGHCAETLGHSG